MGASPFVPPIKNLDEVDYLTSENLWDLQELPGRLVVLGGGPIGCEMAQAFSRLGSNVTQIEMAPRILQREDDDIAHLVIERLEDEGLNILSGTTAKEVVIENNEKFLLCESINGDVSKVPFDHLLVAVGRKYGWSRLG